MQILILENAKIKEKTNLSIRSKNLMPRAQNI